jgi:hypothetical protein
MIKRLLGVSLPAIFIACSVLTGCASPRPASGSGQARSAIEAECRARADQAYARQNRADVYNNDILAARTAMAPLSSNGLINNPTQGLSERYAQSSIYQRCLIEHGFTIRPTVNPPSGSGQ